MGISRRKFIKAGTLVALSAGASLKVKAEPGTAVTPVAGQPGPVYATDVSIFNQATFLRCLNTNFRLSKNGAQVAEVKLVEVNDLTPKSARPAASASGKECFSAVFRSGGQMHLRQDTYMVEHASLGNFAMLLVPIGRSRQHYEAIYNRLCE